MAHCELASKPFLQCLRQTYAKRPLVAQLQGVRSFSSTAVTLNEAPTEEASKEEPFHKAPDRELVTSPRLERRLFRSGVSPVGSRRRRAALRSSPNIPFEQLPYQCFQEARNVLQEDKDEKLKKIETEKSRLERLREADPASSGGEARKQNRIRSMERHIEKMLILADINDPVVKKSFEDGLGDMDQPIYQFLADRKWREYRRKILMQRITQMKVVPDVLAHVDPVVDVKLYFGKHSVPAGDFVNSRSSTVPPKLNVQPFEKGEKLITIAVVDSDVPNLEKDGFDYRGHFLAINVPISPTTTHVPLEKLSPESQVLLPWIAPYAQKGSPYHRLSTFVMEQKDGKPLDYNTVAAKVQREDFRLRSLETRHQLKPIGVHLFRNQWDEDTADVMNEAGIEGADIELRFKRIEPLPYKPKNPVRYR